MPETKPAVEIVNDEDKLNRESMKPQVATWRDAIAAFQNRGPISDPYKVNVKVGRLMGDVETVVPRDAMALLGTTPYFPLRAKDKAQSRQAQGMEKLAENFTEQGQFFLQFVESLRMTRPLGICYIEPRWTFWPVSIFQQQAETDEFGRVVGMKQFRTTSIEQGMEFKVHFPAAVRPHPYGNSLKDKPNVVIAELVHISEVERLLDAKTYKLEKGVKLEELRKSDPEGIGDEPLRELRRDKDGIDKSLQGDVGLLLRYYENPTAEHPAGRWIHTWNRKFLLLDEENMMPNMAAWQKPIVALRNMSHIGPDRYWPIGMYEMGRDLALRGDDALSLYFQGAYMNSAQLIMFNPDLVNSESLVAEPGNRIPVQGGDFDQAVRTMKVGEPPNELFDLYDITKQTLDHRMGTNAFVSGQDPIRKETATTARILEESGSARMEFGTLFLEQTALTELAYITTKLIDANMNDAQRAQILGFEEAQFVRSADPDSIPGGFKFQFEGSDRINRKAQKNENLLNGWNLLGNMLDPTGQAMYKRKLLESFENFSDDEVTQMVPMPEEQGFAEALPGTQPANSIGEEGAITNPNSIATPATNVAVGAAA